MRLKVEINTREHGSQAPMRGQHFAVSNPWFEGAATVLTYAAEELLGTKLRALYQRKKGRDLFDLWQALSLLRVDDGGVVAMFGEYLRREGERITRAQFERNLVQKEGMPEFLGDILPLLPSGSGYDPTLLPKAKLDLLVRRYVSREHMQKGAPAPKSRPTLRAEVSDFVEGSCRGDYFESFNVNSKNYTEQSNGTTAWIADCNRLLDRCVARAKGKRGRLEALKGFESLFDVIDLAASCDMDIVFFADEGGLWSFGIDWNPVFEAWVTCAAHVEVDEDAFEARVAKVLARFGKGELGMSAMVARRARSAAKSAKATNGAAKDA